MIPLLSVLTAFFTDEEFILFIDSHCHLDRLDLSDLNLNLAEVVLNAKSCGVSQMLCVCVELGQFEGMMQAIAPFENVVASCGEHPLHVGQTVDIQQLAELAKHPRVVAIGETGLDYFYDKENHSAQMEAFEKHLIVASDMQKPVIIHTRDAKQDTLSRLRNSQAKGVLHCFTEDLDMAKQAIDLGWFISISGIITFKNAVQLREVVNALPLDRLLIETDSPYLAPVPHRGKQNQPAYVADVARYIADLKQVTVEQLAQITSDNFYQCFPDAKALLC